VDLFGHERSRLREELATLRKENEKLQGAEAKLRDRQKSAASSAARRQDKVVELEQIIDQLKADLHGCRVRSASESEVTAVESALRDAQAIHSNSTR